MTMHNWFAYDTFWYFTIFYHIIDEFTRYNQAAIIKRKSESVKAFLCSWIGIFSAPRKVFSDNEGEFIAEDFIELCEVFNIKGSATASYSPWSKVMGHVRDTIMYHKYVT